MGPVDADHGIGPSGKHGGQEIEADVDDLDIVHGQPGGFEQGLEERFVGREAGDGDRFALEVGGGFDAGIGEHHQAVQRVLDEGGDGHDRHILLAGEQHFRLVRHPEGIAPRANGLEHGGGIGRDDDFDVEAGLGEKAAILGHVQAGVVGIGIPVEGERDPGWFLGGGVARDWRGQGQASGDSGRSADDIATADAVW